MRASFRLESSLPDGCDRYPESPRQILVIYAVKQPVSRFSEVHVCTPIDGEEFCQLYCIQTLRGSHVNHYRNDGALEHVPGESEAY
jgi:hypothetical protein